MELNELEICNGGACAIGHADPITGRASRVRCVRPERGSTARRQQHRARRHRAPIRDQADTAAAGDPEFLRQLVLADLDQRLGKNGFGEDPGDPFAGRRAIDAEDARSGVAAFEPRFLVEAHSQRNQVGDPRRGFLGQSLDCAAPRKAAPREQRVLGMDFRTVAGSSRGREAALGEIARRGADRPLRDDEHTGIGGCRERGEEARDPAAHHDEVVAVSRVHSDHSDPVGFRLRVENLGPILPVSPSPRARAALRERPTHTSLAVVLQIRDGTLQALLWKRAREPFLAGWSLPGGYLEPGETLEQSIRKHLAAKVDVREVAHLEQLETLSDPDRDPHKWQIATAYLGLVPTGVDPELPADTAWHPVSG